MKTLRPTGWATATLSAIVALGAVGATPAAAATGMTLPGPVVTQLLVDPAHHLVFTASGIDGTAVGVADYDGQRLTTLPIPGAVGLALAPDASVVYVGYARAPAPVRRTASPWSTRRRSRSSAGGRPRTGSVRSG